MFQILSGSVKVRVGWYSTGELTTPTSETRLLTCKTRFVAAGPDAILASILDKWRAAWLVDKHKTWEALKDIKDSHGVTTRQEILTKLQADTKPPSP